VAGGGGVDLRPGEKSYRRRKLARVTHVMRLGTESALKAALQGLGLSGRLNTAFIERVNLTVRHGVAALARRTWATSQQASQLLAHLEWWRAYYHFVRPHASLRIALMQPRGRGGRRLAQRYRRRTPGHGSWQNEPTMDGARGALLPLAKGFRLRGIEARWGCRIMSRGGCCKCQQQDSDGASLWEEKACPDCPMINIQPEVGLKRLVDLSTISNRSTLPLDRVLHRYVKKSLTSPWFSHVSWASLLLRRALAIYEEQLGPDHFTVAMALRDVALVCHDQGRHEQSESLLQRALAICEKQMGPDHPRTLVILQSLDAVSGHQGSPE
jgi:hypothetical protein